jgi:thiazole synthase
MLRPLSSFSDCLAVRRCAGNELGLAWPTPARMVNVSAGLPRRPHTRPRSGNSTAPASVSRLEVIGDEKTLFPDNEGLLEATRVLVKEGFVVLPYTNDDVVNARKLIDAGASAVMPLAAPIGSGMGVQNSANLRIMREMITTVPLIVDAGVGTASDAAIAMELGADGVLMNTAIAAAEDAASMAKAMKLAVEAGRLAYLAGRMPMKLYASASSPLAGVVGQPA